MIWPGCGYVPTAFWSSATLSLLNLCLSHCQFNDQLISPKHFVHLAGKSTLKDWKRAIRLGGIMLRYLTCPPLRPAAGSQAGVLSGDLLGALVPWPAACSTSGGEILVYRAGFFILSSNGLTWGNWGWEGDGP